MMQPIELTRPIILDDTGLRIELENDFILYYRLLIYWHYYKTIETHTPKHGAHITIISKKLHKDRFNPELLSKYHKKYVTFIYYPEDMRIGGSWFTNFWFPVKFYYGDVIKKESGIDEKGGYHITIANTKNNEKT